MSSRVEETDQEGGAKVLSHELEDKTGVTHGASCYWRAAEPSGVASRLAVRDTELA